MLDSQKIYCESSSERMGANYGTKMIRTSTTCEVSNFGESRSMNKIRSGKVIWAGRVLELGAREVPCLFTIGTTFVRQQIAK